MDSDARFRELHHFETEQAMAQALAALDLAIARMPAGQDRERIGQAAAILRAAL